MEIRKIENEFVKYSDRFTFIKRNGMVAMFKRKSDAYLYYEVIVISEIVDIPYGEKLIPGVDMSEIYGLKEAYPGSEQFGSMAICTGNRDKAESYYNKWVAEKRGQKLLNNVEVETISIRLL